MRSQLDYQDIAMYFDKLVRAHDVDRSAAPRSHRLFTRLLLGCWVMLGDSLLNISMKIGHLPHSLELVR